ncbi:MAG: patatin-like phospholipase family protein [Allorhizobium sp.]
MPVEPASGPTVAIALGAGGARGFAHIHVISALNEMGIVPVAISGSSIGAIMGAGMAAGMSGAEIGEYAVDTVGRRGPIANRLWSLRPASMRDVFGGLRIGHFDLERILKAFLPDGIPADFAALKIPLQVMVTDYYGQSGLAVTEGNLIQALAASAAIPALFMPVRVGGRVMIDGGIVNPVPYEALTDLADIVIGVDVVGGPGGDGSTMPNRIDSLFGSSQLMMQAQISLKLKLATPDIFLRPAVNGFGVLDFLKAREIIKATAGIKDELKRALDARLTAFRRS